MNDITSAPEIERSTYRDLSIVIKSKVSGGYTAEVYDGLPEGGHGPVVTEALPFISDPSLQSLQHAFNLREQLLTRAPCKAALEEMGDSLCQFLLRGQLREVFFQWVEKVGKHENQRLRVRLCLDPALWELEMLFWEGLRIAAWEHTKPSRIRSAFAWLNPGLSFIRHPLGQTIQRDLLCPGRLRILLLYANPPPGDDQEYTHAEYLPGARQAILESLRPLEVEGWVEVIVPEAKGWGLTPQEAEQAIAQHDPHILIILAHGYGGWGDGGFVFADNHGGGVRFEGKRLAGAVRSRAVRLVFAPVCYSASLMRVMAAAGLPAMVGINRATPFPDTHDVERLSAEFFGALARRRLPVEECINRVRDALSRNPGVERPEWILPTLYLSSPGGKLFGSEEELWRVTYLNEYLLPSVRYFPATFDDRQKHLTVAEDCVAMKVAEEKQPESRVSPADHRIPATLGVPDVPPNFSWMRVQEQGVQIVEKEVREALEQYRHIVVVAHAGSGKTTLVRRLVYEDVENARRDNSPLPIVVSLKEWGGKQDLEAFLKSQMMHLHHAAKVGEWLGGRLRAKACRIYLDGLDEVSEQRDEVIKALQDLAAQDVLVVVTSRMAGFDARLEPAFHKVELRPFADDQIVKYAQGYWGPDGKAAEFVALLETNPRVKALATNPLQLTFMVALWEQGTLQLPASRDELYQQITAQLLMQRIGDQHTVHLQAIEDVAFHHLFCRQRAWRFDTGFLRDRIEERLLEQFQARWAKIAPVPPSEEIGKYLEHLEPMVERITQEVVASGLLTPLEKNSFVFLHPTFHEYLAACGVQRQATRNREMRRWLFEQGWLVCESCHKRLPPFNHYFWHPEWQEVLVLLAGVLGDATPLLQRLQAEPDDAFHAMLSLAAACLGSTKEVEPKVAGEITEAVCQAWRTAEQENSNTCTLLTTALEALGKGRQEQWAETVYAFLGASLREQGVHRAAAQVLRDLTGPRVVLHLIEALKDQDEDIRETAAEALRKLKDRSAVPALLETLKDEDGWIRLVVVKALGELQAPQAVPGLIEVLKDEDREVRKAAVQALSNFKDPQFVPALAEALKDKDKDVRLNAVYTLWFLKDPQVIPYLIEALKDKDVIFDAVRALVEFEDFQVLPGLLIALRDKDKYVRRMVVWKLGHFKDPRAIAALLTACKDEDKDVRRAAAKALIALEDPSAIPILHEALSDEEVYVRQVAAEALGKLKDPQAGPALVAALKDKHSSVRRVAIQALGDFNDPSSIPLLYEALKERDEEWEVRWAAAKALGTIQTPEALAALYEALKDEDGEVRWAAGWVVKEIQDSGVTTTLYEALKGGCWIIESGEASEVLGNIWDPEIRTGLYECLKDREEHWAIRVAAVKALGKLKDLQAVPALLEVLNEKHEDRRLCRAAVEALGKLQDPRALPALWETLTDPNKAIRETTVAALGEFQDPQVVPGLVKALKDENRDVRLAAVRTLGKLKDLQAVPVLLEVFKEQETSVCRAAVMLLGELKEPRAVPALLDVLKEQETSVCRAAVMLLGELKEPRAVPALLDVLKEQNKDEDPWICELAVEALGKLQDPRALPALWETLTDPNEAIREATVAALGEFQDPQVVPGLVKALKDKNRGVRLAAVRTLGKLKNLQAVPVLLDFLDEHCEAGDRPVFDAAVKVLGDLKDPRAVPTLLKLCTATRREKFFEGMLMPIEKEVYNAAVKALISIKDPRAFLELRMALRQQIWPFLLVDGDYSEEQYQEYLFYEEIRQSLEEFEASSAVPLLIGALNDEHCLYRREAAKVLEEVGDPEVVLPLLSAAKRWKENGFWEALETLGKKAKIRIYEDGKWTQLPPVEPSSVEAIQPTFKGLWQRMWNFSITKVVSKA